VDDKWRDRIRWRARRGLLENDLLLTRYLDQNLDGLQPEEVQVLDRLLRLDDNDLLDLLMGRTQAADQDLAAMVANIRNTTAADLRQG
jgi:antitoxin CptB